MMPAEAWIAIATVGLVAICAFAWRRRRFHATRNVLYRRKAIMTDNEREFHVRLSNALPGYGIYPQVPMLALMDPIARSGTKAFALQFRAISNRRVDWLIEHAGRSVIVELDDRTHDRHADRHRDALLAQAGYRVLRYESRSKPKVIQIRQDIGEHLG